MSLTKSIKNDKGVTADFWVVSKVTNHLIDDLLEVMLCCYVSAAEKTAGSGPLNPPRIFWMSNVDTTISTIEDNIKADTEDTFFSDAVKA